MTIKFGIRIVFRKAQVCAKFHCPSSAVTLFSEDGEGNPLLLCHRKPKEPSYSESPLIRNSFFFSNQAVQFLINEKKN